MVIMMVYWQENFFEFINKESSLSTASYYGVGIFGCGGANVGIDAMSENEILIH